mmetsp:Transcript_57716/g.162767  ORF Transcript_57716/g.162767 Transcript_57716/m.162767 type:complete len:333 (-) Transcript_57716:445-1443(-)
MSARDPSMISTWSTRASSRSWRALQRFTSRATTGAWAAASAGQAPSLGSAAAVVAWPALTLASALAAAKWPGERLVLPRDVVGSGTRPLRMPWTASSSRACLLKDWSRMLSMWSMRSCNWHGSGCGLASWAASLLALRSAQPVLAVPRTGRCWNGSSRALGWCAFPSAMWRSTEARILSWSPSRESSSLRVMFCMPRLSCSITFEVRMVIWCSSSAMRCVMAWCWSLRMLWSWCAAFCRITTLSVYRPTMLFRALKLALPSSSNDLRCRCSWLSTCSCSCAFLPLNSFSSAAILLWSELWAVSQYVLSSPMICLSSFACSSSAAPSRTSVLS